MLIEEFEFSTSLPSRLDGFFIALRAISMGVYPDGGLSVTYPAEFDRNNLEIIVHSNLTNTDRSGGNYFKADRKQLTKYFFNIVNFLEDGQSKTGLVLIEVLCDLLRTELDAQNLEFWLHDGGSYATLYICINPGVGEQWLELFWSMD